MSEGESPPARTPESIAEPEPPTETEGTAEALGCFSEADVARIAEAVRAAERDTSGEIVTYIVQECEDYRDAPWKGAVTGALLAAAAVAVVDALAQTWGGPHPALWFGAVLAGVVIGYAAAERIPRVRRWASTDDLMISRVHERAEAAFLEEEVFATRARTGILLFVALFERRAVVIGDEGINAVVDRTEWEEIVAVIVKGMRSGDPTGGLIEAAARCGALLGSVEALAWEPGDENELSDRPRLRRR